MAYRQRELFSHLPRRSVSLRQGGPDVRPRYSFDFGSGTSFSRNSVEGWPRICSFQGHEIELKSSDFATVARRPLQSIETDWLRVALAFYVADRCAPRRPEGDRGATFWRRSIHVTIPVVEVKKWKEALPSILEALRFLTEDDWEIKFVNRAYRLEDEKQKLEPLPQRDISWVSLFSGGLDSAAGAIDRLTQSKSRGLLVSGDTHNRLKAGQEQFVGTLRNHFPDNFDWLSSRYGLPIKLDEEGMESSQRCRGWIHVAMGLLAAHLTGVNRLEVFENGIGAFNLPCDSSQFGSQTSRAVHPLFLRRIAEVASLLLERELKIENPYLFTTKGEMVTRKSVAAFSSHLQETFSCDQYPNRHSSEDQCGVCPSCLIRRAGLAQLANFSEQGGYTWDVISRGFPADLRLSNGLVKMGQFVERIDAWHQASDPWEAFLIDNPDYLVWEEELTKLLSLDQHDFRKSFIDLHARFSAEWKQFENQIPYSSKRRSLVLS